jgi:hypothetical protein
MHLLDCYVVIRDREHRRGVQVLHPRRRLHVLSPVFASGAGLQGDLEVLECL